MTEKQMMERIKQLEQENERLKTVKPVQNIKSSMVNQAELSFIIPYYSEFDNGWRRSSVGEDFIYLRKLAMTVVNKVNNNNFVEQKVRDLSPEDLKLVVNCADELVKIVAKYKKKYLESIGREDIIKAFNM